MTSFHLLPALLLAATASAASAAQLEDVALGLEAGPDPYGGAVARTVSSIVEYSRWPAERQVVRLCLAGPVDHAGRLDSGALSRGRQLRLVPVSPAAVAPERCDAVYLGRLSLDEQRRITAPLRGGAVLTIAENDPACRGGAMVCLLFQADSLTFRINLDAVSRSQVRIDPRVLRMSAEKGSGR